VVGGGEVMRQGRRGGWGVFGGAGVASEHPEQREVSEAGGAGPEHISTVERGMHERSENS